MPYCIDECLITDQLSGIFIKTILPYCIDDCFYLNTDQLSGIFIKSIIEGSTAESDGRLQVNDQIVEVSHFEVIKFK